MRFQCGDNLTMQFRTLAALAAIALVTILPGCTPKTEAPAPAVQQSVFGTTADGHAVNLYTLTNAGRGRARF
jgi:hypothetical protein